MQREFCSTGASKCGHWPIAGDVSKPGAYSFHCQPLTAPSSLLRMHAVLNCGALGDPITARERGKGAATCCSLLDFAGAILSWLNGLMHVPGLACQPGVAIQSHFDAALCCSHPMAALAWPATAPHLDRNGSGRHASHKTPVQPWRSQWLYHEYPPTRRVQSDNSMLPLYRSTFRPSATTL